MKHLALLAALPLAFAFGTAHAQVEDEGVFEDQGVFEEEAGLWETDNWGTDEFGVYDEDFTWDAADDEAFDDWCGEACDEFETAHWGVFGFDDAAEAGLWDW